MDTCNLKTFRGETTFVWLNGLRITSFSPLQFAAVVCSLGKPAKELALSSSVAQRVSFLPAAVGPGAFTHLAGFYNVRLALRLFEATPQVQNAMIAFGRQRLYWKSIPSTITFSLRNAGGHGVLQSGFDLAFFSSKFKEAALVVDNGTMDVLPSSFDSAFFYAKFKEAALSLKSPASDAEPSSPTIDPLVDDVLTVVEDELDVSQSAVCEKDKFVDQQQPELAQPTAHTFIPILSEIELSPPQEQLDCVLDHVSEEVQEDSEYSLKDHCQEEEFDALQDYILSEESSSELLEHHFNLPEDITENVELDEEYWQDQLASTAEVGDLEDESYLPQDIPLTTFDEHIRSIQERYWTTETSSTDATPPDQSRNARRRRIRKHKKAQSSASSNNVAAVTIQQSMSSESLPSRDAQDDTKKPRRHRTRKRKTKAQNA